MEVACIYFGCFSLRNSIGLPLNLQEKCFIIIITFARSAMSSGLKNPQTCALKLRCSSGAAAVAAVAAEKRLYVATTAVDNERISDGRKLNDAQ